MKNLLTTILARLVIEPRRLVKAVDGGWEAYFYYSNSDRFVSIAVDTACDITVLFSDRKAGIARAEDIYVGDATGPLEQKIKEFLDG